MHGKLERSLHTAEVGGSSPLAPTLVHAQWWISTCIRPF